MTWPGGELEHIDLSDVTTAGTLASVTPGEVLYREFMEPLGLSARALARDLGISANRVTAIRHGSRAITAETALLLGHRFTTSAEFWMNLQTAHDLEEARRNRTRAP